MYRTVPCTQTDTVARPRSAIGDSRYLSHVQAKTAGIGRVQYYRTELKCYDTHERRVNLGTRLVHTSSQYANGCSVSSDSLQYSTLGQLSVLIFTGCAGLLLINIVVPLSVPLPSTPSPRTPLAPWSRFPSPCTPQACPSSPRLPSRFSNLVSLSPVTSLLRRATFGRDLRKRDVERLDPHNDVLVVLASVTICASCMGGGSCKEVNHADDGVGGKGWRCVRISALQMWCGCHRFARSNEQALWRRSGLSLVAH